MAGLLDSVFGSGDPVSAPSVNVSPETEARLNQINSDASRSTQDIGSAINKNVGGALDNESANRKEVAMGGGAANEAIRNRYAGLLGQDISRIKSQGQLDATGVKSGQLQNAANIMQARQKVNMQNYERQMKAYQANEAARSAAIRSVFSLAGTIGGAVVGGPVGAAAGGKVGDMAGQNTADYSGMA